MPTTKLTAADRSRSSRFTAALKARGESKSAWCRAAGISRTHCDRVLARPNESAPLTAKIEAYIAGAPKGRQLARSA